MVGIIGGSSGAGSATVVSGTWDMRLQGGSGTNPDEFYHSSVVAGELVPSVQGPCAVGISSASAGVSWDWEVSFTNSNSFSTLDPYASYFGFLNKEVGTTEFCEGIVNNSPPLSMTFGVLAIPDTGTPNAIGVLTLAGATPGYAAVSDGVAHPAGTVITIKSQDLGNGTFKLSIKASTDTTFHDIGVYDKAVCPNGVKPILIGIYMSGPTQNIPFNFGGTPGSVVVPNNPAGRTYLVSYGRTYNGVSASENDLATFVSESGGLWSVIYTKDYHSLNFATTSYVDSADNALSSSLSTLQSTVDGLSAVLPQMKLTYENYGGSVYGATNVDLQSSDTGVCKVVTWGSDPVVIDYTVNLTNSTFGQEPLESGFLLLVLPDTTSGYTPGYSKINLSVVTTTQNKNYVFDACKVKKALFKIESGSVSVIASKDTDGSWHARRMPEQNYICSDGVYDGHTYIQPFKYSSTKEVIISATGSQTFASINLICLNGDRLPQLDDEGITIRFSMVGSSIATVELYGFGSPINIGAVTSSCSYKLIPSSMHLTKSLTDF